MSEPKLNELEQRLPLPEFKGGTMFGRNVAELDKDNLLRVIQFLASDNTELRRYANKCDDRYESEITKLRRK